MSILESLSISYYYLEQYDKAIEYGQKIVQKDQTKLFIFFIIGSSYIKLGKMKTAKDYLLMGLKLQPKDVNILYSLGILEGNIGNFEEAKQYLNKALIIQRSPDIIYALALTQMKLKNNNSAAELFEEYQKFYNTNAEILYKLGLLYIELKNYDRAKKAFKETLSISPENKRAKEYLHLLEG